MVSKTAIENKKQETLNGIQNAGTDEKRILDLANSFLEKQKMLDLLGADEAITTSSEIANALAKAINEIIEKTFAKCGKDTDPCAAIKKKVKLANKILEWEKLKDILGVDAAEVYSIEEIFARLFTRYKLNYDVEYEDVIVGKGKADPEPIIEQLLREPGFFARFRALSSLRRQKPTKKTRTSRTFLHYKIEDMVLYFSFGDSNIDQGSLAWRGNATVEYAEKVGPFDSAKMQEARAKMQEAKSEIDKLPPEVAAKVAAKLASGIFDDNIFARFEEKPLDVSFLLKIKCANESINELTLELSYNISGYVLEYHFFWCHTEVSPKIKTNLSTEVERLKEISTEAEEDFSDFAKETDTVSGFTLGPRVFDLVSDELGNLEEIDNLLKGKNAKFTHKLEVTNANDKLADGVYEVDPDKPKKEWDLFRGKANVAILSQKTNGKITLELLNNPS